MRFWQEKEARRFWLALAVWAAVCALLAGAASWSATARQQRQALAWEEAVAAALFAQGVPEKEVAAALMEAAGALPFLQAKQSEAGEELSISQSEQAGTGEAFPASQAESSGADKVFTNHPAAAAQALLARLGHSEAAAYSGSALWRVRAEAALRGGLLTVLLTVLPVAAAGVFLERRERLYERARETLARFAAGEVSLRLPQAGDGGLRRLFAQVNELATALEAQGENERRRRVFLKDTLSDISHQLKTPLAAFSMDLEIVCQEPALDGTARFFVEKARRAALRMERLVLLLLKMARLDAGAVRFEKRAETMGNLAREIDEALGERARREGKRLLMQGEADCPLCCDPLWTGEAMTNLVKNGLDHTRAGQSVRVVWERTPGAVRICVEDNGSGIAPEELPHIFKRFYRSGGRQEDGGRAPHGQSDAEKKMALGEVTATDRDGMGALFSGKEQGAGLGLPFARAVIEGQGGSLQVKSRLGEGTVFTVLLPDGK